MASILEEKDSIRELLSRYCHHLDARELEAWTELFTPDCVVDVSGMGRFEGRDGLLKFIGNIPEPEQGWRSKHCVMNELIEVDGDVARSRCYLVVVGGVPQLGVSVSGRYEDRLRKHEGRWLFEQRSILLDQTAAG